MPSVIGPRLHHYCRVLVCFQMLCLVMLESMIAIDLWTHNLIHCHKRLIWSVLMVKMIIRKGYLSEIIHRYIFFVWKIKCSCFYWLFCSSAILFCVSGFLGYELYFATVEASLCILGRLILNGWPLFWCCTNNLNGLPVASLNHHHRGFNDLDPLHSCINKHLFASFISQ